MTKISVKNTQNFLSSVLKDRSKEVKNTKNITELRTDEMRDYRFCQDTVSLSQAKILRAEQGNHKITKSLRDANLIQETVSKHKRNVNTIENSNYESDGEKMDALIRAAHLAMEEIEETINLTSFKKSAEINHINEFEGMKEIELEIETDITAAQNALDAAQEALENAERKRDDAQNAFNAAQNALENPRNNLNAAQNALDNAQKDLKDALKAATSELFSSLQLDIEEVSMKLNGAMDFRKNRIEIFSQDADDAQSRSDEILSVDVTQAVNAYKQAYIDSALLKQTAQFLNKKHIESNEEAINSLKN